MADTQRLDALLVADGDGTISQSLSASGGILGHEPSALVGQSVCVLVPEPDAAAHPGYIAEHARTGESRIMGTPRMVQARHKAGHLVNVLLLVTAVRAGDGYVYVALIRDQRSLNRLDALARRHDDLVVQARINIAVLQARSVSALLDEVLSALVAMPELAVESKAGVFLIEAVPPPPERPGRLPVIGRPERALRLIHTVGEFTDGFLQAEAWVPLGGCLCGRAALSGAVLVSAHCDHDPRHEYRFEGMTPHGHYIIPLRVEAEVLGVLFLYTQPEPDSSPERLVLLETVGAQIGLALRRLRAEAELVRQAHQDALTGLLNRRAVRRRLAEERSRARRGGHAVAVIILDIDHFKRINDTFGHPAGDAALREVARRLGAAVRQYDVVGRYGGEEFLVVLPACDLETAVGVAERIRAGLAARPFQLGAVTHRVTASLGVASTEHVGTGDDTLISAADAALYAAKAAGRDRVRAHRGGASGG